MAATAEERLARFDRDAAARDAERDARRGVNPPPAAADEPGNERYGLPPEVVARIRQEQKAKVDAELRRLEKAQHAGREARFAEQELERQRRSAGLTDHLDDLIMHTINVAPFSDGITIDGVKYHQGYTYTFTRRVYNDVCKIETDGWLSEDRAGNPNKRFYRRSTQQQDPFALQKTLGDGSLLHRQTTVNGRTGGVSGEPIVS